MRRLLFLVALGVAGAFLVRHFLFEGIYLKTDSMAPTLPQGAHVFVSKAAYFFHGPKRGEIIQFHTPQQPDAKKDLVKRIIAVGGDTIRIKAKQVFVNDQLLSEPYIQNLRADEILVGDNEPAVEVPKDCVFVMGDNRDVSSDSRDWKDSQGNWSPFVCGDSIQGRAMVPEQ